MFKLKLAKLSYNWLYQAKLDKSRFFKFNLVKLS